MVDKKVHIQSKPKRSKSESRRPAAYDAGTAHEAQPDAVDEIMGSHAAPRSVMVERNHHKGTEM